MNNPKQERIQKIIAGGGHYSRRGAEELIKSGKVTVNGRVAKIGEKASAHDSIVVDGVAFTPADHKYVILNKPSGYIVTKKDPEGRKTIYDLQDVEDDVFPIGRLDRDTEGLLILTNDGDFAQKIAHPSYEIEKTYLVRLNRDLRSEDVKKIERGFELKDERGKSYAIQGVHVDDVAAAEVTLTVHQGKYHIVKNIFKKLGYRVDYLQRKRIGNIGLDDLKIGEVRTLSQQEISELQAS